MAFELPDPITEVYAQIRLSTEGLQDLDYSGFTSVKARFQLGAADEFTIELPAQTLGIEGLPEWRADMPVWQVGGTIYMEAGYDGEFHFLQVFEIVSTTIKYPSDAGGEMMTCLLYTSDAADE